MAPQGLGRSAGGETSTGGTLTLPPYKDPAHADFFLPRIREAGDELIKVYATVAGTIHIWKLYQSTDGKRPFAVMQYDGNPAVPGYHHDPEDALLDAVSNNTFVYNFQTRRAWRPVWFPSTPVDKRDMCNVAHETIDFYGWKSFIEGWAQRPRARLFIND